MANHQRYIDPATGMFSEQFTEKRDCPACKSSNSYTVFEKSGGVYVACEKCKMIYLNPVFKDEHIEAYYRTNHIVQGEIVGSDAEFYTSLYSKGLDLIAQTHPNRGKILDVGCSHGFFLDLAQKAGWECYGLELNHAEAAIARTKRHVVQENLISAANFEHKFDAIVLWDVYEHIKDGVEFLNHCRALLNGGGIVFLQAPSCDALAAKVLQSACNMFDGLEHVNLYGHESLTRICETTGFELTSFETVISEIGVINNYLEYQDPYLGNSSNKSTVLKLIDEETIFKNRLGYKFQACLKMNNR